MSNNLKPEQQKPETDAAPIKPTKRWWRYLIEIGIILAIFFAVMAWQERHLLSKQDSSLAPQQSLISLNGEVHQLPHKGSKQLIYFFAPWCQICHLSIGNIESQRESLLKKNYQVRYVALSWESESEIREFADDHKLTFPVLLGTIETMEQYQVKGFPTYYLIDEDGIITGGSQGYSSSLGVWLRSLAQ